MSPRVVVVQLAAFLASEVRLSLGQVCHSAQDGEKCGRTSGVVQIPYAAAAFWAESLIPSECDVQEGECDWHGAAAAWHYTWNNLRLALDQLSPEDQAKLPMADVQQVHTFIKQLGWHPGIWYGNWHTGAAYTRHLIKELKTWLQDERSTLRLPQANIGTQFPTLGRSVSVPTDGNMGATVTLANGFAMPILGFGTWELPADGTAYRSTLTALELGYRHIDTAQGYQNEHEVGRAMRDSRIPRSQICLVTKLSNPHEYRAARKRFESQLATLQVDYVDIYMLHSPGESKEDRQKAWSELETLYDEGKIKALGVSNFDTDLLTELLSFARIRPVYIQNKYSIYMPGNDDEAQKESSLMEWLGKERIVMTGYSIIHPAHGGYLSPLNDPHVVSIAQRYSRTPSQILHRWLLQLGAAVIPRSTKRARIQENGLIFDFVLSEEDMRLLNGIGSLVRSVPGDRRPTWCDDVYGLDKVH